MKKLEDFRNEEIKELNDVFGGRIMPEVHYGTNSQTSAANGCCYEYHDWFVDSNGNGTWDQSFETGGTYNPKGEYLCD